MICIIVGSHGDVTSTQIVNGTLRTAMLMPICPKCALQLLIVNPLDCSILVNCRYETPPGCLLVHVYEYGCVIGTVGVSMDV